MTLKVWTAVEVIELHPVHCPSDSSRTKKLLHHGNFQLESVSLSPSLQGSYCDVAVLVAWLSSIHIAGHNESDE